MRSPRIALIDDHIIVRKGLRSLVEAFNEFEVAFDVENFTELTAELKANKHIDLLLMDIIFLNIRTVLQKLPKRLLILYQNQITKKRSWLRRNPRGRTGAKRIYV